MEVGELIGYLINYIIVDKIERKKYSIGLFGCVSVLNLINVLVKVPNDKSDLKIFMKCI